MATKIQVRRDTSSTWGSLNPTPHSGEICFETNTKKVKVGDGTTSYSALPYVGAVEANQIVTNMIANDAVTADKLANSINTDIAAGVAALPKAGGTMAGNIVMSGSQTVDGRDLSADGTKLDGIEASATADQTGAQIKTAYQAETNAFTDAQFTKLAGVEASADVTDTANVTSAGALMKTGGAMTGAITTNSTFDGRDVSTDGTKLDAIQAQATKNSAGSGVSIDGSGVITVDAVALTTVQTASSQSAQLALTTQEGDVVVRSDENKTYVRNANSNGDMTDFTLLATPTDAVLSVNGQTGAITAAQIATAVEAASGSNTFTDADHSKLNAIEASADVTDATNVTAAGALMDSEVTNLAEVKAFDTTDYATSAQGTTANAALPKTGGAMTGAITTNSTFDGRDVATDGTKLDGIEASATADQTDAQIRAAVEAASDSNVFTDADHTKLNGIESSATADQTDAQIRAAVEAATDSNVFTDADHTKLGAIEASATADQTDAEIKAAVEAASDSNTFTDADHTKLNGIEASATADQTAAEIKTLLEDGIDSVHYVNASIDNEHLSNDSVKVNNLNLISTSSVPSVEAKGDGSSQDGYIQLNCSQNSHGIKLKSPPHSANASYTLTFPDNDGNANQILTTDGSGVMTWASVGSNSITAGDVNTAALGNGAVTTIKIADDAVTEAKLNLISTGSVPSLEAKGTSGVTDGYIQLNCAENSHGIKLKSPPHSAGADYTLVFPTTDGNTSEFLQTNGSGVMTWAVPTNTTYSVGDGGLTTNDFTNADHSKLNGIEASATADQTKADIEGLAIELPAANLTGTIAAARLSTATTQSAADNSTKVATTAYTDTAVANLVASAPSALNTLDELAAALGDDANYATTTTTAIGTKLPKAGGEMTGNITMAGSQTVDGRDLSADGTKLDAIEASADVTDTANVTSAGALMDSEVTNLSQVKAFASSDYATAAQGTKADAAMPKAGGAFTGAVTTNSTIDGRDVAADGVTADAALPKAGGTMTGDLILGDNVQIEIGSASGGDLRISHDGSDSIINEAGTGNLLLMSEGSGVYIQKGSSETMAQFVTDGAVNLYHNNAKKFETTAAGATVTGNLAVTGTVDGIDIAARDGVLTSTTTTAGAALPKAGGAMTGAITTNSTFDGRDVATDGTKLDGIEASATADQTAAQIKTHLENGIDSVHYVDGSIDHVHLAADCVDGDNIGDDVINSEHYAAGSIDTAHIADAQITVGKMAANSIDSNQYVDGSIDTAHIANSQITSALMAANSIDSASYVDGSIDTAHIGNDQVTADKLANSINTDIATGVTGNTTANNALPKAGGTMTGNLTVKGITETVVSTGSGFTVNLANGTVFVLSGSGTVTMPSAAAGKSFTVVVNTGTHVTWGGTIEWNGGSEPAKSSGIDTYVFICGTTSQGWLGAQSGTGYA